MKDIRQKLLATFQVEHRDHVEQIRSLLAMVARTGVQPALGEIEEAFRRAHSLKGAARAVDLAPVEGLAHRLETLFSRVRQGALLLDKEVSGAAEQALNASEDCVTALGGGLGENRPTPGFQAALAAMERVLGMQTEAAPVVEEAPIPIPAFQPLDTVRISTRNFDGMLRSASALLLESQRQNQLTAQMDGIARQVAAMSHDAANLRRKPGALDSFERNTRTLARQVAAARRWQQRSSWTTSRLGKQLQQDVWQARMVPAESLLEGYRKMMRDLARDESKQIEFLAASTGVQADRRVLDALKDPLMHLLRNSVSHGIETPKERAAREKPAEGKVALRIDAQGQRLIVTITDDGRGLDFARIVEVAVRQGILSEQEAARSSPRELAQILFRPGFSTSRTITDLSGRGMGLSVVYEAIRRLQGEVELQPAEGSGTCLRLSVPLSISTHKLLLVTCGRQPFAVPIHMVERLHRIRRQTVETVEGKPVVTISGQPIPLFSLAHLLGLEGAPSQDMLHVMVLRSKSGRVAIAVDEFLRESDAVIQDLGPAARNGKISGGVLLDDGRVAFVLDSMELLSASTPAPSPAFLKAIEPAAKPVAFSILVVDDSLTTRTLERSILEANGYRVRVAVDGMEALAQLRVEKADLVISDIQMPRLDGFGLLAAMKADRHLDKIPVIVVTSLDRREDQARGLELGADAYIVKRKFDQGELLAAIRQIL